VAVKNRGITELVDTFWQHRQFLKDTGAFTEHNFKWEFKFFRQLVMEMAADRIFNEIQNSETYLKLCDDLKNREMDPFSAAEMLTKRLAYK
jgi:putative protein kinase ArgK-like GTPase of G3E family